MNKNVDVLKFREYLFCDELKNYSYFELYKLVEKLNNKFLNLLLLSTFKIFTKR